MAVFDYFTTTEQAVLAEGNRISAVKSRIDKLVLQRVANVAFADIFRAFIDAGADIHSTGMAVGEELSMGTLLVPVTKSWIASVDVCFPQKLVDKHALNVALANLADVKGMIVEVAPRLDDTVDGALALNEEMFFGDLTPSYSFTHKGRDGISRTKPDIWTPYGELGAEPLAVAALIEQIHRATPGAQHIPGN